MRGIPKFNRDDAGTRSGNNFSALRHHTGSAWPFKTVLVCSLGMCLGSAFDASHGLEISQDL